MTQKPETETLKALNNNITDEFRANAGRVGGRFEDNELLLLTTKGAKSGEPRVAPLVAFRIEGKLLIVAGYGGADVNPAWVHNLRANPRAHVQSLPIRLTWSRMSSTRPNVRRSSPRST